ncbi:MAG TPA: VTT domain-containing protein [Longimicrobium sp.]|nr:VTT domain-containing protein [Longimicrobium sp.]
MDSSALSGRAPSALRWAALVAAVLAMVLLPFLLFGARMEAWTAELFRGHAARPLVALLIAALLAGDVLLPVPSSLVGTAAGYSLGFAAGTLTAAVGMTIGSLVAYALGRRSGQAAARRLVGARETERLRELWARAGDWAVVVARPVPVLAEASAVFAGIGGMPLPRFLALSALANLGISAAYAAVGRFSARADSFLLAFAGAVLLPGAVLLLARLARPRRPAGAEGRA